MKQKIIKGPFSELNTESQSEVIAAIKTAGLQFRKQVLAAMHEAAQGRRRTA